MAGSPGRSRRCRGRGIHRSSEGLLLVGGSPGRSRRCRSRGIHHSSEREPMTRVRLALVALACLLLAAPFALGLAQQPQPPKALGITAQNLITPHPPPAPRRAAGGPRGSALGLCPRASGKGAQKGVETNARGGGVGSIRYCAVIT